jgi:SurA N-terminal domain
MTFASRIAAFGIVALMAALAAPLRATDVIDRIIAVVNAKVITQSDWEDAVAYEALVENQPVDAINRKMALERLIDQELLRQQMPPDLAAPSATDLQARIAEIRRQYPGAASDERWRALLSRYGLNESDLAERIATQLTIMRFVDQRLRPSVHVDANSIEQYYREKFLPDLRKAGAADVPLAEVSSGIEEVLAEQRVGDLLSTWLKSLRTQSNIRVLTTAAPESAEVR